MNSLADSLLLGAPTPPRLAQAEAWVDKALAVVDAALASSVLLLRPDDPAAAPAVGLHRLRAPVAPPARRQRQHPLDAAVRGALA